MSTKRPDVIRPPPSPQTAMSLAEMHLAGWQLRAQCSRCGLHLRASLPAMIRVYGPDAIWWGRQPPCPGFDCDAGLLSYSARSINGGSWVSMKASPSATQVALWRDRQGSSHRGQR